MLHQMVRDIQRFLLIFTGVNKMNNTNLLSIESARLFPKIDTCLIIVVASTASNIKYASEYD